MTDELNNSTAPSAQAPESGGEGARTQAESGIQKRIDELVGTIHKKDEMIQTLLSQHQQMLAEQAARAAQAPQADPLAGLLPEDADETTKATFAKMGAFFARQLDEKLKGIQTQLAVSQVGSEVQRLAARYNVSEAVASRTQELLAGWRQQGLPFNVEDALRFAAGEVALKSQPDPRTQQVVPVFRASNPMPVTQPVSEQPLPNNFDDLSIEEQWNVLARRVGDKPL